MAASSYLRPLAWVIAASLFVATLLAVGLNLDLFAKPPALPESHDLVQNLSGSVDDRHVLAPFAVGSDLLFAVALILLVPFGALIARASKDGRLSLVPWLFAVGGVLGATSQLLQAGAISAADMGYCDCGFKTEELISQMWALNVIGSGGAFLTNASLLLIAGGIVLAALALGAERMPATWRSLSWLAAAASVAAVVVSVLPLDPIVGTAILGIGAGVLVPVWTLWIGQRLGVGGLESHAASSSVPAGAA
jgi:hypothetical protein